MNQHHSTRSKSLDELLSLLADCHCRATLQYFRESGKNVASVQDLANEISKKDHGGTERVTIQLQHSVLPRLADADVVDYDARSRTIRYYGRSELEGLSECIREGYPAAEH